MNQIPPTKRPIEEVLELLDLERIEANIFRGLSPPGRMRRIFGGQVLGQALIAASRTVEGRVCHSFHGYFLRPGDPRHPIFYEVDRSRDGTSFTSRRVVALQKEQQIFTLAASFQMEESGLEHQFRMPDVPPPESLEDEKVLATRSADQLSKETLDWLNRPRPIEIRPVDPGTVRSREKRPPFDNVWIRATGPLPDDPAMHQAALAYASDMTLLDTALLPHGLSWESGVQMASLDHAMWFHRRFRADEWLLYAQDSPNAGGSRGFNRGSIFTREGQLVASVAQEGLLRKRPDEKRLPAANS